MQTNATFPPSVYGGSTNLHAGRRSGVWAALARVWAKPRSLKEKGGDCGSTVGITFTVAQEKRKERSRQGGVVEVSEQEKRHILHKPTQFVT